MITGRICKSLQEKIMSARDAAELISEDMTIGCSGFTMAGYPKVVPHEIAELGKAKNLTVLTGASVGDVIDGELVKAGLMKRRFPYHTNGEVRKAINDRSVQYADFHLSHMPFQLDMGIGPHIDFAVIECESVTQEGIVPTTSTGASDCFVRNADKVILEVNATVPDAIGGIHDIARPAPFSEPAPIDIYTASDRIGLSYIPCPPEKIAAIVLTDDSGEFPVFRQADCVSERIAKNIVAFLRSEIEQGRLTQALRPIQSGVGSVANAVLKGLADGGFTDLEMYTEVMQDSALELIASGVIKNASATALSLSREKTLELYRNLGFYKQHIIIRPQEISNHPEVIRRLGLISMNTPIECDLFGNVNSTHILGTNVMNGIGGSGDFARNAAYTIFAAPSTAKGGEISSIVPMVSHVDHTDHDVMIIVTEHGVADLRWKTPLERAEIIIENCAHPDYRDGLFRYLESGKTGHMPINLDTAFDWHKQYRDTGSMKGA